MTSLPQPIDNPGDDFAKRFLRLWQEGEDTASIAEICGVRECVVYNFLHWKRSGKTIRVSVHTLSRRANRLVGPYRGV